jgi:DNA-cytosine methyltransferase
MINVVSLFDGKSCGMLALERAGIPVGNYYASEVDKYAIQISEKNFPEIIRMGDVETWRDWDIDWSSIDLVLAGSPCQGFSLAGKQLAFDDPRSKLFFTFIDILNVIKNGNPEVKFLLENVKMKKEHLAIITEYMEVEPVFINSQLLSAQSRQRFYWANWEFGQPEDLGIKLIDVIEDSPDEFTLMSKKFVERQQGRKCLMDASKEKAANLSAMEYVKNGRQGDYLKCDVRGGAIRGRHLVDGKRVDDKTKGDGQYTQMLKVKEDNKANAVTTVQKDSVVVAVTTNSYNRNNGIGKEIDKDFCLNASDWRGLNRKQNQNVVVAEAKKEGLIFLDGIGEGDRFDDGKRLSRNFREGMRIYSTEGKAASLTASTKGGEGGFSGLYGHETDDNEIYYRKLTVIECERLQTLPDNYTDGVSNTQRYKMIGNGWTVDVIAHIFKSMGIEKKPEIQTEFEF